MQYMLLIYENVAELEKMNQARREAALKDGLVQFGAFTQDIVKSGNYRASGRLQPASTATVLRQKDGKRVTTDGPFAETKEQLGGYYLVECKDLDEALAIAGRIPSLSWGGTVEVRAVFPPAT